MKYLILILSILIVGCEDGKSVNEFTSSLKKQGYLYSNIGIANHTGNRHNFLIKDTTHNKIFVTQYNSVTGGNTPFEEAIFK